MKKIATKDSKKDLKSNKKHNKMQINIVLPICIFSKQFILLFFI